MKSLVQYINESSGCEVTIQDNMKGGKSYTFTCNTTTKEGIVRAIKKNSKEIIKAIELYFGDATITVKQNGEQLYKGKMENNTFGGGGTIELR